MIVSYRELRAPSSLAPVASCLWQQDAFEDRGGLRVIPDGCVDMVWIGGDVYVVGPDTGPVVHEALPAVTGLRLRPGAAGPVLGIPASAIRDQMVPLAELWPTEVPPRRTDPADQLRWLATRVLRRQASPDPLVRAACRRLWHADVRIRDLAQDLGVTERTLHRSTSHAVGYGPKTLARVIRLRRLIACSEHDLADRAHAAGYASQSHMSDEVRRLTGLTPVRFLEDARLTAA